MKKIVINSCHGGFGLSHTAVALYAEFSGINVIAIDSEYDWWKLYYIDGIEDDEHYFRPADIKRDDPHLIAVVAELGEAANDQHADLKIVEIPDDIEWEIAEYDGLEWIAEKHRTWR